MLGYLLWGEHAMRTLTGPQALCDFLPEWMETVEQYYNHPSVIGWMCYNETYNLIHDPEVQRKMYQITKKLDPYRPVIDASGGIHYQTDMFDVHDYEQDPKILKEALNCLLEDESAFYIPKNRTSVLRKYKEEIYEGQPIWISECGGAFWAPEHLNESGWGYGKMPQNDQEFIQRYEGLIRVMAPNPRICGFCYTQLTDVEQEQNGLYYYDKKPKFSNELYDRIRAANQIIAEIEK